MKQAVIIGIVAVIALVAIIKVTSPKTSSTTPTTTTETIGYNTSITPMPTPAPTQPISTTPAPTTKAGEKPRVEFTTPKGKFVIEMNPTVAPKTVANYLDKWTHGYCDNMTFHRVEDWVVQGCDPKGDGTGGGDSLPTETSKETFAIGSVGVARKQFPKEISNDSQFFIVKTDAKFLDGEYTWFGKVISGMDVVTKIAIGDKILSTKRVDK